MIGPVRSKRRDQTLLYIIDITGGSSSICEIFIIIVVGQKAVRLASSYEYVVRALRDKLMEYISNL